MLCRESVVSGEIPAKKLAVMTSEEMASEEQKAALKKIKEDNLFQSLSAQETEAETEAFQCSKCKQVSLSDPKSGNQELIMHSEEVQVQASANPERR